MLLIILLGAGASFVHLATPAWKNATLHVWWGWKDNTLVEPRIVDVQPGSIQLLAGEDLDTDISLLGFTEQNVTLNARAPGADVW